MLLKRKQKRSYFDYSLQMHICNQPANADLPRGGLANRIPPEEDVPEKSPQRKTSQRNPIRGRRPREIPSEEDVPEKSPQRKMSQKITSQRNPPKRRPREIPPPPPEEDVPEKYSPRGRRPREMPQKEGVPENHGAEKSTQRKTSQRNHPEEDVPDNPSSGIRFPRPQCGRSALAG